MTRAAVVVVLTTAACGRLGFDDVSRDGAVVPDAAIGPDAGSALGTFGGPGTDVGFSLAAYPDGGVVVVGWLASATPIGGVPTTNAGATDLAVFRLAADGTVRWARTFGGPAQDLGLAVAVAADGTIYVVGQVEDSIDLGGGLLPMSGDDDGFIASYTADGAYRWGKMIGGPVAGAPFGSDEARGVAVNADGVYVCGYISGAVDFGGTVVQPTGGDFDAYLAAYDADGGLRWVKRWGDTRYNTAYDIATEANGDVIVGGFYEGTPDLGGGPASAYRGVQDTFIVARDRDGNFRWQADFGGPGFDWAYGLDIDSAGNLYVGGFFETSTDLAGGLVSAGSRDAVISSWTAGGGFRWARVTGGAGCDIFRQLAVIDDVAIGVGGFADTIDFGPPIGAVTAGGSADALVRGYRPDGTPAFVSISGGASADFTFGLAGTSLATAFVTGEVDGSGGDWCQAQNDTNGDGSIDRLMIP